MVSRQTTLTKDWQAFSPPPPPPVPVMNLLHNEGGQLPSELLIISPFLLFLAKSFVGVDVYLQIL